MKLKSWLLIVVPLTLYFTGITMNMVVMAANQNMMPVLVKDCDVESMESDHIHTCYTKDTKFKALSDWLYVRRWDAYASPGDIVLILGDILMYPCFFGWVFLNAYRHRILTD